MTEYEYIIDSTSIKQRYDRIVQIITALENQQIAAVTNSDVEEYEINDGQIKIRTLYRSASTIAKAIHDYEVILNRLEQQLAGTRIVALRDASSIRNNGATGIYP